MANCPACGGLIMEPGVSYGYAGKVCHCERGSFFVPQTTFQEICDTFKVTPLERSKLVEHLKLIRNLELDKLKDVDHD